MISRAFDEQIAPAQRGSADGQSRGVDARPAPAIGGRGGDNCAHYETLVTVRRNLHDQVGSSLAGITMALEAAQRLLGGDVDEARRLLFDIRSDVNDLITNVRHMVDSRDSDARRRGCHVTVALRSMIGRLSRMAADRITLSLEIQPEVGVVRDEIGWAAFWIVREAVANVLKHSMAQHCAVSLTIVDGELLVRVRDDGIGIAADRRERGSGQLNMTERAAQHGGWCTVENVSPSGVAVLARFPLGPVDCR